MRYIKYFESVNSKSVVELLKSYGIVSKEELDGILDDKLLELKDIIQYFNDDENNDPMRLLSNEEMLFNHKSLKINDLNNRSIFVNLKDLKNTDFNYFLRFLRKNFQVLDLSLRHPGYSLLVKLIDDNIFYYDVYKYSQVKMKTGDYYIIKPIDGLFKENFTKSLDYSIDLVKEFRIKLNPLIVMYDVGFSYDGNEICIRILPK